MPRLPLLRYLHAVEGRDAEMALPLSDLAAHGDAARLPKSIVGEALMGARAVHAIRWSWP